MHSLQVSAGRGGVTIPVDGSGGQGSTLQASLRVVIDQQIVEVFTGQTPYSFAYMPLSGGRDVEMAAVGGAVGFDVAASKVSTAKRAKTDDIQVKHGGSSTSWHVYNDTDLPAHNFGNESAHTLPAGVTDSQAIAECEAVCDATPQICTGFVFVSTRLAGGGGPRCALKTGAPLQSIPRAGCVAVARVAPQPQPGPPPPPAPPPLPPPRFQVTAHKLTHGFPAFDTTFCQRTNSCNNASIFEQTFNPTYLRLPSGDDALIMRAANIRGCPAHHGGYCADHLVMAKFKCSGGDGPGSGAEVASRMRCEHEKITAASIIMQPSNRGELCGLLDPRAAYDPVTRQFVMSYWAYADCEPGKEDDMLLATSADGKQWERRGELYGQPSHKFGVGGPAVMVPRAGKNRESLLFYMQNWDAIAVVSSSDPELLHWNVSGTPNTIASSRYSDFDNAHMEPAAAIELRSGLILLLYTTVAANGWGISRNLTCAKTGNPPICWVPGYVLVDCGATGSSCRAVQRSAEPLLLPTLPWELEGQCAGMGTSNALMRLEPGPGAAGAERFLLHYDAADMRVGAAVVSIEPLPASAAGSDMLTGA